MNLEGNEWLIPIGDKANKILLDYPRTESIKIASAILTSYDSVDIDIPWVVVFPSDDLEKVCTKLLEVLYTPYGQTPFNAQELQPGIQEVQSIMEEEGALGDTLLACYTASYLIRAAAGKPNEPFLVYRDLARLYPQYAEGSQSWENELRDQFGSEQVARASTVHQEMFGIIRQTAVLAGMHKRPSGQKEDESTSNFIKRIFEEIPDGLDLLKAAKLIPTGNLRNADYRRAAFQLRGMPLP